MALTFVCYNSHAVAFLLRHYISSVVQSICSTHVCIFRCELQFSVKTSTVLNKRKLSQTKMHFDWFAIVSDYLKLSLASLLLNIVRCFCNKKKTPIAIELIAMVNHTRYKPYIKHDRKPITK